MIDSHTIDDVPGPGGARDARMAGRPRGGRRPGAGRPRAYTEPLVRKTITLPASYLPLLEREGRANLSEGIRLVIEQACTPGGYYWFPMGRTGPRR